MVFFGGGKIEENIGAIAPPLKRVKKSEIYPISPPPSLINVDFEARFEAFLRAGIPTLMRELGCQKL